MVVARFLIGAAIFLFLLVAPSSVVISCAVISLAQAHFLIAYYYHYKTGKVNRGYILRYIVAFVVVFGSYYFFEQNSWPAFLMGSYFVVHFLYDERYLMSEPTDFFGWFRLAPIMISCAPVAMGSLGMNVYTEARVALLLFGGIYLIGRCIKKIPVSSSDLYFLYVFVGCSFLTFSEYAPNVGQAISFIALSHYGNWYLHYLVKFRSNPVVYRRFLLEILFFNAVTLSLFFCYQWINSGVFQWLKYFSQWDYFSLWTLMHFFVTFRKSDLGNWVPFASTKIKSNSEVALP